MTRLVSITRAAQELGVSPQFIRAMIRAGRWRAYVLGPRTTRVDLEEILSATGADGAVVSKFNYRRSDA